MILVCGLGYGDRCHQTFIHRFNTPCQTNSGSVYLYPLYTKVAMNHANHPIPAFSIRSKGEGRERLRKKTKMKRRPKKRGGKKIKSHHSPWHTPAPPPPPTSIRPTPDPQTQSDTRQPDSPSPSPAPSSPSGMCSLYSPSPLSPSAAPPVDTAESCPSNPTRRAAAPYPPADSRRARPTSASDPSRRPPRRARTGSRSRCRRCVFSGAR